MQDDLLDNTQKTEENKDEKKSKNSTDNINSDINGTNGSAIEKIEQELKQIEKIEQTPAKEQNPEFKMPTKIEVPKLIQRPPVPATLVQPPRQFQKDNSQKTNSEKDSLTIDPRANDTGSNGQKNDTGKNSNKNSRQNRRQPVNKNLNPNRNQPVIKSESSVQGKVIANQETTTTDKKKFDRNPNRRSNNPRREGNQQNRQQNLQQRGQQSNPVRVNLNLSNKSISVIIPLYNEEDSLVELSIALKNVMEDLKPQNYEVLFIDDGSSDNSFSRITEICRLNNKFKCIKFKRNYGKSAALSEGFKAAKGDYIITMDADLQDDPEEIPALIQKMQSGYDLVSGWKKVRHDPFIKKHTSKLFNFATSMLVGLKLHDYNCGLKGYVRDVVKNVKIYGEMHRYIPAIAFLSGFKVAEIPVTHHERKFGKTKFGASRFINGLFDLLTLLFTTKYIKRPLHFFGFIGLISFFAGFGILAYLTVMKFVESFPISGRPLFFVGILFSIVGMQSFSIGLIGEMITKSSVENDNIIIEKIL